MRRIKFFPLIFVLAVQSLNASSSVNVLCYHSFDGRNNKYSFSLKELSSHLEILKSRGYRFISLQQFKEGDFSGTGNILIICDDGKKSVYDAYYSVFRPMGIRPVLAVYPAVIGKASYALTWQQLRALHNEGCGIAAHGYYHLKLNGKLYKKDSAAFSREIRDSKKHLEQGLGITVDSFVYPYGIFCGEAVREIESAGFLFAFTVENGPVSGSTYKNYRLPRYVINRENLRTQLDLLVGEDPAIPAAAVNTAVQFPVQRIINSGFKNDAPVYAQASFSLPGVPASGTQSGLTAGFIRDALSGFPVLSAQTNTGTPIIIPEVTQRTQNMPSGSVEIARAEKKAPAYNAREESLINVEKYTAGIKKAYLHKAAHFTTAVRKTYRYYKNRVAEKFSRLKDITGFGIITDFKTEEQS